MLKYSASEFEKGSTGNSNRRRGARGCGVELQRAGGMSGVSELSAGADGRKNRMEKIRNSCLHKELRENTKKERKTSRRRVFY
jgi:hypothetical protein